MSSGKVSFASEPSVYGIGGAGATGATNVEHVSTEGTKLDAVPEEADVSKTPSEAFDTQSKGASTQGNTEMSKLEEVTGDKEDVRNVAGETTGVQEDS